MADITKITLNGTDYNVKDPNAQPTLVSGTNIKTINNQSILGSGDITIQGGSGETFVELTQAQYNALTAYSPDTTYIITDATPIDLDGYATTATTSAISADVSTLSGNVSTLSGTVSNKADKASVTANSARRFPKWNAQGIITGTTGYTVYERNFGLNGAIYDILRDTNSDIPTHYAPTSPGTENAVLLANGVNNAPTWSSYKFQFITQTQYDALSTKDSTTIYFIVGD